MLSYTQIAQFAAESAIKAKIDGLKPYSIRNLDLDKIPPFPFPDLGDYRPEGWELVDSLFCDSSGFGDDTEPALTVNQLIEKLKEYKRSGENYGFGIIETGEFQVVLGVFKPDSRDFTHSGSLTESELRVIGGKREK